MRADEVASRNALLVFVAGEGQRSDTGVGVENLFASQQCSRENAIRFAQQIVNFIAVDLDVIEIALVANVGSADQILAVPGNDEEGPAISFSFNVYCRIGSAGEWGHDDVAALCAAD